MKTKTAAIALTAVSLLLIVSCKPKTAADKTSEAITVENALSGISKEEILKIQESLPSTKRLHQLISASGVTFLAGITSENIKPEEMLTRSEKAKALGVTLFDIGYTHTYKQTETKIKLFKKEQALVQDLGFTELADKLKEHQEALERNKNNADSLEVLYENMLNETKTLLDGSSSAKDLALIFAGTTVKSLQATSFLILFANHKKDQLLSILQDQKEAINAVCEILGKFPKEDDIKEFLKVLTPVNKIFQSEEPFTVETVEKINDITTSFVN